MAVEKSASFRGRSDGLSSYEVIIALLRKGHILFHGISQGLSRVFHGTRLCLELWPCAQVVGMRFIYHEIGCC